MTPVARLGMTLVARDDTPARGMSVTEGLGHDLGIPRGDAQQRLRRPVGGVSAVFPRLQCGEADADHQEAEHGYYDDRFEQGEPTLRCAPRGPVPLPVQPPLAPIFLFCLITALPR